MKTLTATTSDCPDSMAVSASRFDTVIEKLLIALLLFMPFALGAKKAWSKEVVIALSAAIIICFSLKLICDRRQRLIWTWAYIPVGIFLLIIVFQLVPLPASLLKIISPNTLILKTELLGDLPNADTLLKSMTLSFYPNATKHDLRLVLSIIAVFVVVLNVFRRPDQIKRLLMAIALIGGCVAMLALLQDLFGNGKIYWFVFSPDPKALSGPFINHNHYGQFMNLSIGAAIGCICIKLNEDFFSTKVTLSAVTDYFGSASARALWLLVGIIALGAVTIFVSLTRGGMISLLIAAAFTTLLLTARQSFRTHSWIMVVVALAAFTCILYIGFDAVYDRLATLSIVDSYKTRIQILNDLTASYGQFPIMGMGLGTHSVVYPMFQTIDTTLLFTHAENEYAQLMEEVGLVGLISMIVFGVFVWAGFIKNIRQFDSPISSAAYGLGFGLLAILIHSLSDFGQHLPANAYLSAIFCALLLGLARQDGRQELAEQTTQQVSKLTGSLPLRLFAFVVVLGILGWSFIGADNARIAESHWNRALAAEKVLIEKNWQGTDQEYAEAISYAAAASDAQPENIKYRYWLNVYRWSQVSLALDPDFGVLPEGSMPAVHDIVNQFHKTRTYCPTYGPTYSTLGQIEKNVLNDEQGGAERIKKGFRLAPNDPISCLAAGSLDIEEGNIDLSFEKFNKAVKLNGRLFKGLAVMYASQVDRPDLALDLAGVNVDRLNYVAKILEGADDHKELINRIQIKRLDLLKEKCSQPDASATEFINLANIYRKQQDFESAIEYYQRALTLDYARVDWRYRLARMLVEAERIPEAMNEAKICLRLRPQFKAAKKLIENLSVHPKILSSED